MKCPAALLAGSLLLLLAPAEPALGQEPPTPISLTRIASGHVGDRVVVTGVVKRVSYTPFVRDGRTLLSFSLVDEGSVELRVLTSFAGLVSKGDRVQVSGVLIANSSAAVGVDLDAQTGDLNVLEQASAPAAASAPPPRDVQHAVSTFVVDTKWSVAVDIASIASAVFAVIAAFSIVLYFRRFNVGLFSEESERLQVTIENGERAAYVGLRLLSTGNRTAYVGRRITLAISGVTLTVSQAYEGGREMTFPFSVERDTSVRLRFIIPAGVPAPPGTRAMILMPEAFCGAVFRRPVIVAPS